MRYSKRTQPMKLRNKALVRKRSHRCLATDTLTLQGSTIQGGQGISVTAAGILQGTAATLAAGSGKLALAGSIVDLQGGINASQSHTTNTFKKTGVDIVRDHTPGQGIAYKHRDTQDQASTTLAPTTLSGASISITSTVGHTTLAGVQVHHPDTPVALDSAGELHLQTVTTTEQTSSTGQASNLAWQRMQNQGRIDETTHYNQLGNNVTSVNTISRSEPRSDSDACPVPAQQNKGKTSPAQ